MKTEALLLNEGRRLKEEYKEHTPMVEHIRQLFIYLRKRKRAQSLFSWKLSLKNYVRLQMKLGCLAYQPYDN